MKDAMKRPAPKKRRQPAGPSGPDVREALNAVGLVIGLLDLAMGYGAAEHVFENPHLGASAMIARKALEVLYQDLRSRLASNDGGRVSAKVARQRLEKVLARATKVLGGQARALGWMATPNREFAGVRPRDMLGTKEGAAEVMEVLGRILYGVYG